MAPPLSPIGIIYQALIQSNCQTFLGNDVDVDIVSQLDSAGTWSVHVLKTEGGKRSAVLSESSSTLQGAFIELHRKSAMAVDSFVVTNGFDLLSEVSTQASCRRHRRRGEKEKSPLDENLEIVSVRGGPPSSVSSESEDEAEVSADSESDDSLDRNTLGGNRCKKAHRRGSRRMAKKKDESFGSGGPTHRPVVIHSLPPAPVPGATSTTTTTAPIPVPTSVCVPPPPPPSATTKHFGGFNQATGPPWRGSWHGSTAAPSASQVYPLPPPPPPPAIFRPGTLMQGPQPHSNYTTPAQGVSMYHHQPSVRAQPPPPPPQPMTLQQRELAQQIRNRQQTQQSNQPQPHKLPTRKNIMLCIRWMPHGEVIVLEDCHLSIRAVQNRAVHLLRTRGPDFWQSVSPLDVTPSALESLSVTVKGLRLGQQVYVLGPGCQDDVSALQIDSPMLLRFEIEVTPKLGGQAQQQQQQRQQWLFTGVGRGKTGINSDE